LIFEQDSARKFIEQLKIAKTITYRAKDICTASSLSLLGISNSRVESDLKKIRKIKKISPILLVRDTSNGKLIIADGYHRLCAVYSL
jgi:hypothetical protein